MHKSGDQAEGLRRLNMSSAVRTITVASGGTRVGKTTVVANLALALAGNGKNVLVIDEDPSMNGVNASLGLAARSDLVDVIEGRKSLEDAMQRGPNGIRLLTVSRGLHSLANLTAQQQAALVDCFGRLHNHVEVVLVDTAANQASDVLPPSLAAEEVLLVLSGSSASITDAYALVKIMSQRYARRRFLVLVNKVRSEQEASRIFGNVSRLALDRLEVSIEFAGCIPADDKLSRSSALCQPLVEAFPSCPIAARFRRVADELLQADRADHRSGLDNFMHRLLRTSRLPALIPGL
jgi:flagellar biosynthesis protein FlhG